MRMPNEQWTPAPAEPRMIVADYLEALARDLRLGRRDAANAVVLLAGASAEQLYIESIMPGAPTKLEVENATQAALARAAIRIAIPMT